MSKEGGLPQGYWGCTRPNLEFLRCPEAPQLGVIPKEAGNRMHKHEQRRAVADSRRGGGGRTFW